MAFTVGRAETTAIRQYSTAATNLRRVPGVVGFTSQIYGNTFIQGGVAGGGYLTGVITSQPGTANSLVGSFDVEQNTILTNLYHAEGGPWDHVSAVGATLTIGDTSQLAASQQIWFGGEYFYSDPANGGISINPGVYYNSSAVPRGSTGQYLIDNSSANGTQGANVEYVAVNPATPTVVDADFWGYNRNSAFPNYLWVTSMVSGTINAGVDELHLKTGGAIGAFVANIWSGQYTYPKGAGTTAFGTPTAPAPVTTTLGAAFNAYSPGGTGSGTDTLYVRNVTLGNVYFGDTFTVTGTGQSAAISGAAGGWTFASGAGDYQLSGTLYTNAGTTPPNSFSNKKVEGVYVTSGTSVALGNEIPGHAGQTIVANQREDGTGVDGCMALTTGNPMFTEQPVFTGNKSLLEANGSGTWAPVVNHHQYNVTSAAQLTLYQLNTTAPAGAAIASIGTASSPVSFTLSGGATFQGFIVGGTAGVGVGPRLYLIDGTLTGTITPGTDTFTGSECPSACSITAATTGIPQYLELSLSGWTTMVNGGAVHVSGNGATGWPADWSGEFFIPTAATGGNPGSSGNPMIIVTGNFTTPSATWSGATPFIEWWDASSSGCTGFGYFHQ